jgi:hypothetical protein
MTVACPCPDLDRDLTIRVVFSTHCYTERFDSDLHDIEQIICREHGRIPRVFCPIRHGLSFRLPEIVTRLPREKVYQTTQQRNYVYSVPLDIDGQAYEVFFSLRVEKGSLRMMIESAYPVEAPSPRPKRPNSIRFRILAYKTLCGEQVRFAAR